MCEIWKWIAAGTAVPLVVLVFWNVFPATTEWIWRTPENLLRRWKREERIRRYQRLLILDALVCFIAVVVSLGHCT